MPPVGTTLGIFDGAFAPICAEIREFDAVGTVWDNKLIVLADLDAYARPGNCVKLKPSARSVPPGGVVRENEFLQRRRSALGEDKGEVPVGVE